MLTPNKVIQELHPAEFKLYFDSDQRKGKKAIVNIPSVGPVTFGIHSDWSENKEDRTIQARYCLVAKFRKHMKILDSAEVIEGLLPTIDDFLLLCGFGTRIPVRCVGWIVNHGRSNAEYYRRTQWLPKSVSRQPKRSNEGLIPIELLPNFLSQAASTLQISPIRSDIRLALHALNNSAQETIERRFVGLLSALEGLVSALSIKPAKRIREKTKDERAEIRKQLKVVLDEMADTQAISDHSYKLYSKAILSVEGLISFAEKLSAIEDSFHLKSDDLWPLVAPNNIISLYKIRNIFAHGRGFKQSEIAAILVACRHIECTLERLICEVFRWPLADTDIEVGRLAEHWHDSKTNWKVAAAALK